MDYQAKFTQLLSIINPSLSFPRDFDWKDEQAIDALITDARDHAKTLGQYEALESSRKAREATLIVARGKVKAGDFDNLTADEKTLLRDTV